MKLMKSTSMRSMFRKCPRLLFYRYVAAIKAKEKVGPRFIGSVYHSSLEKMRIDRHWQEAANNAIAQFDLVSGTCGSDTEKIKVVAYIQGYWNRFCEDFNHEKILTEEMVATEDEVCYIDAAIVNPDKSIIIIEDKTTASFSKEIEDALKMNEQLLNYLHLCDINGINIESIKYRETLKSSHKVHKNESLAEFRVRLERMYLLEERFREITFERNDEDLKRYINDKMIIDNMIEDYLYEFKDKPVYEWPCNGSSCTGKFGGCDFLPICARRVEWYPDLYEANGKEPIDNYKFQSDTRLLSVMSVNTNPFDEKHEVTNDQYSEE